MSYIHRDVAVINLALNLGYWVNSVPHGCWSCLPAAFWMNFEHVSSAAVMILALLPYPLVRTQPEVPALFKKFFFVFVF